MQSPGQKRTMFRTSAPIAGRWLAESVKEVLIEETSVAIVTSLNMIFGRPDDSLAACEHARHTSWPSRHTPMTSFVLLVHYMHLPSSECTSRRQLCSKCHTHLPFTMSSKYLNRNFRSTG